MKCPNCTSENLNFETTRQIVADGQQDTYMRCEDCGYAWSDGEDKRGPRCQKCGAVLRVRVVEQVSDDLWCHCYYCPVCEGGSMGITKIEWADRSWNPVTGCTKVSEGCANCYAERMAKRLAGRAGYPRDEPFRVTEHWDRMKQPLHWRKPARVFVVSMGDLFHADVPESFIDKVLEVIAACPQHVFMVLTKRPQYMQQKLYGVTENAPIRTLGGGDYLPNLWLGVSAENQQRADERIPILLDTPAAVRFVSCEPLLGPIDLHLEQQSEGHKLDWIVAGAESGPGRRKAEWDWFGDLRDQCEWFGVPFFLKQMEINGQLVHMPELEGQVWDQYPEVG